MYLSLVFGGGFEFGHDLKDAVAALLGLVEFKVQFGRVFNMEGFVDLRLPLLLKGIEVVQDLVVGGPAVEVGDEDGSVTKVRANVDPGDGEKGTLQGALPADEPGENAPNGF